MKQWEYKCIGTKKPLLADQLDACGQDGWELVQVIPGTERMKINLVGHPDPKLIQCGYLYVFKRPVYPSHPYRE